jgi:hypothetical protein
MFTLIFNNSDVVGWNTGRRKDQVVWLLSSKGSLWKITSSTWESCYHSLASRLKLDLIGVTSVFNE